MNNFFKRISLWLFLIVVPNLWANSLNHQIDQKYYHGSYLIYDCQLTTWVCVDENNYQLCHDVFAKELKAEKEFYTCLGAEIFDSPLECAKEQKRQQGRGLNHLCVRSDRRRHLIEFQ